MRRKDREIKDAGEVLEILRKENLLSLAMCDGEMPYVVPLHYGLHEGEDGPVLYLHCAHEGRKLDLLARNPKVCFSIVGEQRFVAAEQACGYGTLYESAVGEGMARVIFEHEEKALALTCLMQKVTDRQFVFDERMTGSVAVLRIDVTALSGKRRTA